MQSRSRMQCRGGTPSAHPPWMSWGVHKLRRTPAKQTGNNTTNLLNIQLDTNVRPAKLCLLNAISICNKADFLVDYVADHDLDILCITETWLPSSAMHGPGFGSKHDTGCGPGRASTKFRGPGRAGPGRAGPGLGLHIAGPSWAWAEKNMKHIGLGPGLV